MSKLNEKDSEQAEYKTVAELGGLDCLRATYHHQNFSRHTHEGYTVGVIDSGAQRFFRNGAEHTAPRNSIILVNHDEVHDGHSASEAGWSYKAIYPLARQIQLIRSDSGLKDMGSVYFPEPVVNDPELSELLRLTFHHLLNSNNRLLRETLLYSALLRLMQRHAKIRPALKEPAEAKKQMLLVKSFIDSQPELNVSLEELTKLAGVSKFHLIRQFQKYFGLPPHAYQIQSRIRRAKSLIKAGEELIDVAQKSGFHDQSHLTRHFKKALGVTPGQLIQTMKL